jgi:hypothetical protein
MGITGPVQSWFAELKQVPGKEQATCFGWLTAYNKL